MKLWYQSLARQTETTPYGAMLRRVIDAACDPGTTVHMQGVAESAGIGVHYRLLEYHDTREVIYNAMRAEREGFDAFLIGNISDAGIREAREAVNIPVLGLCETSLHIACMMGASFSMVSISEKWTPRLIENITRYGLEKRLVAVEPMSTSPLDLKRVFVEPDHLQAILSQFNQCAERLLARGSEVIIPAGGDIIVFLADMNIYQVGGAPILNGIVELVKMGELAVKLRRHTGRYTSKRGGYAAPSGDFLERIRKHYGPELYPSAK
ncbi:MAG TPA: aspartate/glutamate racemase family protein [Burkholderiales bacterium]|nr:aspartate/glutamate racemase family protein [Burkholderiales bacterium]